MRGANKQQADRVGRFHLSAFRSNDLGQRHAKRVVDHHHLTTREQTDAFKAEHGVATTPQVFIEGERIGGYDDLARLDPATLKKGAGAASARV